MKMIRLNFFGIFLIILVLAALVFLPSLIIQSLWNSAFQRVLDRDFNISLWQATLLWGAAVSLLFMTGLFKFQIDFRSIEKINVDDIDDPDLKQEIQQIKASIQQQDSESKDPEKPN